MAGGGGFLAFLNETQSEFQIRFFSPLTFPFLSTFVASSVETGDDSRNEKMGRYNTQEIILSRFDHSADAFIRGRVIIESKNIKLAKFFLNDKISNGCIFCVFGSRVDAS